MMRICLLISLTAALALAGSVAGLRWSEPAGWKAEGPRPMRAATYDVPAARGSEPAECAFYFFGQAQGGTVDMNIARWKGQIMLDGKQAPAKVAKRTIHGLAVTIVDATGDYTGMGGPMAPASVVKHHYRLIGAIVEGPGGNLFIKFTGPVKTVDANLPKFDRMLDSFEKTGK
jgi:hypothetical protein